MEHGIRKMSDAEVGDAMLSARASGAIGVAEACRRELERRWGDGQQQAA